MAMKILETCSLCDACRDECPNEAISMGTPYKIEPDKCTECVSYFDEPQCVLMCPIKGCIIPDPDHVESREELEAKAKRLSS